MGINNIEMKNLLTFCFIILCISCISQTTFQKTYGGSSTETNECFNHSTGIINTTKEGGFVICHSTNSYGLPYSQGVYFLKLNKFGDTVFTKTYYRNDQHCYGRSVYQADDGGFILGVGLSEAGAGLIKTDESGNILWSRNIGHDIGYYGLRLKDNSFLCTGGNRNAILSKVDANGNLIFGNRFYIGNSLYSLDQLILYSSYECSNSDIISTGCILNGSRGKVMLIRTDSHGIIKFSKSYNIDSYFEAGFKSIELSDKSIITVGHRNMLNDYDFLLLKTDSIGNPIFFKTIGDSNYQWSNSIVADSKDDLYLTGVTNLYNGGIGSAITIKLNSMGNIIWSKRYDNGEYGSGIALTNDGGIVIAGMTTKFGAGDFDVYICKMNSTGDAGCKITDQSFPTTDYTITTTDINLFVANDLTSDTFPFLVNTGTSISTKCQTHITDIDNFNPPLNFSIFPNPTSYTLNIKSENNKKILGYEVFDVTGRQITTVNNLSLSSSIDISDLNSGVYILKIRTEGGVNQFKFIKE